MSDIATPTVKRGRKKTTCHVESNMFTDVSMPMNESTQSKATKRGRKPKYVYSSYETTEQSIANSDDENVILKLNISNQNDEVSVCLDDDVVSLPDAYNMSSFDTFLKPSELEETESNSKYPTRNATDCGCTVNTNGLRVIKLLKDFEEKNKNNEWPNTTSIHCYWCCHRFGNPPFGIPLNYIDQKFKVYGCFCSLECAAAYNFDCKESADEIIERNNYINMLSRFIGHKNVVKPAPSRLALKIFGGHMDITEFRAYCDSSKLININFPPMMTLTQQIEEINESDMNSDYRYIPIDTDRINRYKEKIKLKRAKPLTDFKNTLDHAMNLKIDHQ